MEGLLLLVALFFLGGWIFGIAGFARAGAARRQADLDYILSHPLSTFADVQRVSLYVLPVILGKESIIKACLYDFCCHASLRVAIRSPPCHRHNP
jgi:hypothetical protein